MRREHTNFRTRTRPLHDRLGGARCNGVSAWRARLSTQTVQRRRVPRGRRTRHPGDDRNARGTGDA